MSMGWSIVHVSFFVCILISSADFFFLSKGILCVTSLRDCGKGDTEGENLDYVKTKATNKNLFQKIANNTSHLDLSNY